MEMTIVIHHGTSSSLSDSTKDKDEFKENPKFLKSSNKDFMVVSTRELIRTSGKKQEKWVLQGMHYALGAYYATYQGCEDNIGFG